MHAVSLLYVPADQPAMLAKSRGRGAGAVIVDLEDAVLAEVHRVAKTDARVADEFVGYFLSDLMRLGGSALSPGLRRFLDTGDLVQSVLGDLWPELASVRFETRGRFLSYLARRLGWKAGDKALQRAMRKARSL